MKQNPFPELLKNSRTAPFYQCPHCRTVWLVMGAQALPSYTCKQCQRPFDLATARYTQAPSEKGDSEIRKAA